MINYHFVVGDFAAQALQKAFATSENDNVVVLKDILNVGPLLKEEGQTFSELRSAFWQQVIRNEKTETTVDDTERLLEISKTMYENENIQTFFWMAPLPADVCAYYWLLFYLSKHKNRFHIINIAGLPFLNDAGKLYFPKSIAELNEREVNKARKLARLVTNAEIEVDVYEWKMIIAQNAGIRSMAGGKKLNHYNEDHYDSLLLSQCNNHFQKSNKIIQAAMGKNNTIPTGDLFLGWRLRQLASEGQLEIQGDQNKNGKDFEVRIPLIDETSQPNSNLLDHNHHHDL